MRKYEKAEGKQIIPRNEIINTIILTCRERRPGEIHKLRHSILSHMKSTSKMKMPNEASHHSFVTEPQDR